MVERTRIGFLTGALATLVLPGLWGCTGPYYYEAPPPYGYPPYYYDYYYYPHVDVYFHIYSGDYWYHDGPYWHRVHRLPPHIHLDPRYRVIIRIPDEPPYRHYDEHRRKYPLPPKPRPEPRVPPQTRPQPGMPPPQIPPSREREERAARDRDREERERNFRKYEEYGKKRWVPPQ